MRGIGKFVVKEIRAYSGQPISEVPIGKLFAYTVIDNKPDSGISTIAISKLGVTARLAKPDGKEIVDFSHYFRWLFANFRECSLIS